MYRFSAVLSGLMVACGSFAATEPQSIPIGGAQFIPTIQIKHSHDDNLFSSDLVEESSTITNLTPRLEYLAGTDDDNFLSVTYDGDYARYWQSRDDDYDDHTLGVAFGRGGEMLRLTADAGFAKLHDNRGEGGSEGLGVLGRGSPDEYDQKSAGATLDFGRGGPGFGASLGFTFLDIEYTNNRALTRSRDRDDGQLEAQLYYDFSDTRLTAGYREKDIDYDTAPLDSEESTFFIAAEWDITGRTTGNVEIGRKDKDFDAGGSTDGTVWSVGVTWSPRTYSVFNFTTSQDISETNGVGAAIENRDYGVSWTHDWSDRLQSVVSFNIGDDEYVGSPRSDDRENYSISLNYDFRRWMNVAFGIDWDDRDSTDNATDFSGRVIYMSVDLSL